MNYFSNSLPAPCANNFAFRTIFCRFFLSLCSGNRANGGGVAAIFHFAKIRLFNLIAKFLYQHTFTLPP
jgi:hypothetical protein